MTKLKTLAAIATSTLALTGAAVTTAQAQPWHHDGYSDRGRDYDRDRHGDNRLTTSYVDGLDWKINNAARQGRRIPEMAGRITRPVGRAVRDRVMTLLTAAR